MAGAVPSTTRLRERLDDVADEFTVTPRLESSRVSRGSIDLSLGRTFLVASRSAVTMVDARTPDVSRRLYREVRITDDRPLVVHPRQLVLAVTFEYLTLPADLCGFLQSRSTYGRLGLISATATFVGAGFKGCPTLELVNAGEVPLQIHPMDPVCQLTLMTTSEESSSPSRYQCSTRPYAARGAAS
jgi:dCTP deaminase